MTVEQLIAKLSTLPGDQEAVIATGDGCMSYQITDVRSTAVSTGHRDNPAVDKVVIGSRNY